MKLCKGCETQQEESKFYYRTKDRVSLDHLCKICRCNYQSKRWTQRKLKAIDYLGGKCKTCGYCKSYAALDFHHRDPKTKQFVWKQLRLRSWQAIQTELDKCTLLCMNCHAELHNESTGLLLQISKD